MNGTSRPPRPVAAVTGAASGIGFALAQRFADAGWSLGLADVEGDALAEAEAAFSVAGTPVVAVPIDVSDRSSVMAFADEVSATLGVPRVVCNNAGVNAYGFKSWEAPAETWQWVMNVNLMGVVNGISAFVPMLLEAGRGHVFNTSSVAGLASAAGIAAYAASKHAIVAVSESLFYELDELGSAVRVSVVCPNLIATDIGNSARHWPKSLGTPSALGPDATPYRAELERARSAAPSPSFVADAVFDAVGKNGFLVFPDSATRESARARRIEAFDLSSAACRGTGTWF